MGPRKLTERVGVLAALLLLALPAAAQSPAERRRQEVLRALSQRLHVPVDALSEVGAERYASTDAADRRALLADLGQRPRGDLVPLVLDAASRDRDPVCRQGAVQLVSVLGLEVERDTFLDAVVPALARLFTDPVDGISLGAGDQLNLLARWFRCDEEVSGLYDRTFHGRNYRLAQLAFYGLLDFRHPALRDGLVREALEEVISPRGRFGVFERKRAILETAERGGPATPDLLARLLLDDGTVAVECAEALGRMGDPSVLPALRRIDRTSAHILRIPALRARARLGDEQLLAELAPTFQSDHRNVQIGLVDALGELADPQVAEILARIAPRTTDGDVRRSIALARLRHGDAAGLSLLETAVRGAGADPGLAREVLSVNDLVAAPLVQTLARNDASGMEDVRAEAVDWLGAHRVDGGVDLLRSLQGGDPSALRVRAAASLLQVGEADGADLLDASLAGFDAVLREDVATEVGTARRFSGSVLLGVLDRLARSEAPGAAPLLARWLGPPEAPAATQPTGSTTAPAAVPDATPPWLAHPFVRRAAVEALGRLAASLAARLAEEGGSDPDARARWEGDLARARSALAHRLDDPAGVVRFEAVRALSRLAGDELPPGASRPEEARGREVVGGWLRGQEQPGGQ